MVEIMRDIVRKFNLNPCNWPNSWLVAADKLQELGYEIEAQVMRIGLDTGTDAAAGYGAGYGADTCAGAGAGDDDGDGAGYDYSIG